jgi:DNA/RNA-binding domain of Phe-tRNA-synthetase-like protein
MNRPNSFHQIVTAAAQNILGHAYSAIVIRATQLDNMLPNSTAVTFLRDAEHRAAHRFATTMPASHPHIVAMRAAFNRFGSKPSKFLCSAEALLKRSLKGGLPSVSPLVDLYNSISIDYVMPVGGEEWDSLTSDLLLKPAEGSEPFITRNATGAQTEYPDPGELIWCDSSGVTCRRLNWRQCERTAIRPETKNAYFVLDALLPFGLAELSDAAGELVRRLTVTNPGVEVETEVISLAMG